MPMLTVPELYASNVLHAHVHVNREPVSRRWLAGASECYETLRGTR